ncbi:MAG: hypothetical protein LIO69_05970 [Oscillospiraceae bacterium]|nr:hypothetical protein [Oscillospiraceae bacterium]
MFLKNRNSHRHLIIFIAAVMALSAVGCSDSTTASTTETDSAVTQAADESETTADDAETDSDSEQQGDGITVRITSVDGNTVTAQQISFGGGMGGGMGGNGDTPPDMPEGGEMGEMGEDAPEKPNGDGGMGEMNGEPSEMPSDISHGGGENGDTPPDMPEGGDMGGDMPQGGMDFAGETITFTLTDSTVYTDSDGNTTDSSIVAENEMLSVVLNDNNEAVSVSAAVMDGGMGGGEMGGGDMPGGNGFGGSGEVTNGTSVTTLTDDETISDSTYSSTGDDENALRIDGAAVTLDGVTVSKSGGDSSNTEDGDFYGQNAALLALNGAQVTITGAEISSSAVNGNGVFSYGEETVVNISDSVIRTIERNSGGIQTTGGGTTNAENLDIQTEGASSAAIRTDRGGGTVNVSGGTYVTNGTGSPAVYCTADITVSDAVLTANSSEGIVVEGKNSVTLNDCTVSAKMVGTYNDSSENIHAIMIYQSMSGDADVGTAYFTAEGGSITALAGDMIYVTNTHCIISLKGVDFTLADDSVFLRVEGNDASRGWGTAGSNGGDAELTAENQIFSGDIIVDEISTLDMTLTGSTTYTGAVNPDNNGGTVNVTIEDGAVWELTADSYITSFEGDISSVVTGGYTLYVNGEAVS